MRRAVFVLLAVLPVALVAWVVWRGHGPPPAPPAAAAPVAEPPKAGAGTDAALLALFDPPLPAAVKGKVALYDEKTLFDYVDGAAPLFLQRHFRRLGAAEMTAAGADLTCDVYDMAGAENAQSIFDAERSPAAKPVEGLPGAVSGPMSFVFRAGRYYVKLTAFDPKGEASLPALARALIGRIG